MKEIREMKDQNEWFHKDEVIELMEDFAFKVLQQVGEPDGRSLISEIYTMALCERDGLRSNKEFTDIIHAFAEYEANFNVGCEDHLLRNKAYLE